MLGEKETLIRIALHGLVGPNNGKTYPGEMAGFPWADDEWMSQVLTYTRNEWGNQASIVTPEQVGQVRKETAARNKPYTLEEVLQIEHGTAPSKK